MSDIVINAAKMMNILPKADQEFALEFIKKLVLAWDPDYTKLTSDEAAALAAAECDEFINAEVIDWDNLSSYDNH